MKGVLSTVDLDDASLVAKAEPSPGLVGRDLVREVAARSAQSTGSERLSSWTHLDGACKAGRQEPTTFPHVVALDYGMKWNIARHLYDHGLPRDGPPRHAHDRPTFWPLNPDGVFLSNGPGDPEPLEYAIGTIRELLGKTPIFGICLGHQLLSLACGGDLQAQVRPPRREPSRAEPGVRARSRSPRRITASPSTKRRCPTSCESPTAA